MIYFRVWVTPHNQLGQFLYVIANQWPGKWDDNQGYVASLYRRIKGWLPDVFLQLMPLMPPFGDFSYSMQSILDKWRQNKSQTSICRVKPSICWSYIWVNRQFFFAKETCNQPPDTSDCISFTCFSGCILSRSVQKSPRSYWSICLLKTDGIYF